MPNIKPNELIEFDQMNPNARTIFTYNAATATSGLNDGSASDTGWLQGRTIASVAAIVAPTGMTLNSQDNTTKTITIDVSSSSTESRFEWDISVTLNTGEIQPLTVIIPVVDVGNN